MQKTTELQIPRLRNKVEWRSKVIPWNNEILMDELTGHKHPVFEDLLNEAFSELAAQGFHVTEVRPYPNGFVVLSNRMTTGQQPAPQPTVVREELTYYRQFKRGTERLYFTSLAEAVRQVAEDVAGGQHIPKCLERTMITSYNREELEDLVATI